MLKKRKPEFPMGFRCVCGRDHQYDGYVMAHWTVRLKKICEGCGAEYTIEAGDAELIRKGKS